MRISDWSSYVCSSDLWVGKYLEPLGVQIAFTPAGVVIALMFIGLPFVVRTVEPVLADMGREVEEAAASLGAGRFTTFRKVIDRKSVVQGKSVSVRVDPGGRRINKKKNKNKKQK